MGRNVKREEMPLDLQKRLMEIDHRNAVAALESLPDIEAAAQRRVERSRDLLKLEEAQLNRVRTTERKEAEQRVKETENALGALKRRRS